MIRLLLLLLVVLIGAMSLPAQAMAQQATPVARFGVDEALPPLALYEALLLTALPADLLSDDHAPMKAYEWRDSNDPDLAGSLGGIIYSDIDPFGSELPAAITYLVFPDARGPLAPLAIVTKYGETTKMEVSGQTLPAGRADLSGLVGHFVAIDNVLVYGMVPYGDDAEEEAEALTEAGVAHLLAIASAAPLATPVAADERSGEAALLAVAAEPYPADDLPFETGPLVVLPMALPGNAAATGLIGTLLVRDADRTYRYPLATFDFYVDEAAASAAVAATVGVPSATPTADVSLPTSPLADHAEMLERRDTTTVVMQVGPTVITVDVSTGNAEERQATALALTEIAVNHLLDVTAQTE